VLAVRAAVICVPLVSWVPLHPPEALQDVALVELHVSVEVPPAATVCGFADRVTVGLDTTATVAEAGALVPPGPVQVRE
jgi:hypothetical protein